MICNFCRSAGTANEWASYDIDKERWTTTVDRFVASAPSPVVFRLLTLHQRDENYTYGSQCAGCAQEVNSQEYDMEPWPCATFLMREEALSG